MMTMTMSGSVGQLLIADHHTDRRAAHDDDEDENDHEDDDEDEIDHEDDDEDDDEDDEDNDNEWIRKATFDCRSHNFHYFCLSV